MNRKLAQSPPRAMPRRRRSMAAQSSRPETGLIAVSPLLLTLAAVCLSLAVGVKPGYGFENGLARIEQSGVLRLGICEEDFPPFSFRSPDHGGWAGYDIDLASALAREMGVELQIVTDQDWEGVIDLVRDGRADIGMSSLSATPERTRKVAFSRSYIHLRQGVLANQLALARLAGSDPVEKLNSPRALIAVRTGSVYRQHLPNYLPRAEIIEFSSWDECYEEVRAGRAAGVIGDEAQLLSWLGRNKGDSMRLIPVILGDKQDPLAIAVPKQEAGLLEYINAFLRHQPQAPDIQRLYWEYKNDSPLESGPQSAGPAIPPSEYPMLALAAAVAFLTAAYLVWAACRSGRKPGQNPAGS